MSVENEKIALRISAIEIKLATLEEQQKNLDANVDRQWILRNKDDQAISEMQMAMAKLQTKVLVYGSAFAIAVPVMAMFFIDFLKDFLESGLAK